MKAAQYRSSRQLLPAQVHPPSLKLWPVGGLQAWEELDQDLWHPGVAHVTVMNLWGPCAQHLLPTDSSP